MSVFSTTPRNLLVGEAPGEAPPPIEPEPPPYDFQPPRVACIRYSTGWSAATTPVAIAPFDAAILFDAKGAGESATLTRVNAIRAAAAAIDNVGIKLFGYIDLPEASKTEADVAYGAYNSPGDECNKNGWWLYQNANNTLAFTAVAGTDLCTWTTTTNADQIVTGTKLRLTTSGTLPGGLATLTDYYAIKVSTSTFRLATSHANALVNNYIDITSTGSGTHNTQWLGKTAGVISTTWGVNYSTGAPEIGGQRYPQWYAEFCDYIHNRGGVAYDGYFMDNSNYYSGTAADWANSGGAETDETNSATRTLMRAGHKAFWDALRALDPTKLLMGNSPRSDYTTEWYVTDTTNTAALMDGAFIEKMIRPFNIGSPNGIRTGGWSKAQTGSNYAAWDRWREAAISGQFGATHYHVLNTFLEAVDDYPLMRLGFCTALMAGGMPNITTGYSTDPVWYDEYNTELGEPLDAVPSLKVTGTTCIWKRRFENGVIIINGDSVAGSGTGSGNFMGNPVPSTVDSNVIPYNIYKRITGTQDPVQNSGATVTGSFSLGAWDGIVLLCVTPGVHS
jgi:hypothetical protein